MGTTTAYDVDVMFQGGKQLSGDLEITQLPFSLALSLDGQFTLDGSTLTAIGEPAGSQTHGTLGFTGITSILEVYNFGSPADLNFTNFNLSPFGNAISGNVAEITSAPAVPLPPSFYLFGTALVAFYLYSVRKHKS